MLEARRPHLPQEELRSIDTERDGGATTLGATQGGDDPCLQKHEPIKSLIH